ncbi:MAG: hypothetical protein FWD53_10830, partial [Phycisphaerales bacterium]|nr:hypothetical protein [Phycisphaerales bacterium]
MHQMTFFPIGNADCCRIDLDNGRQLMFDYAHCRCDDDGGDLRIDLPAELKKDLRTRGKTSYDVVAFTHLDRDHIKRAPEFFYLLHDQNFQGVNRVRINELWAPAAVITETQLDDDDAKIIQKEARYRLLTERKGIRVFSRPERLKDWLGKRGVKLEEVRHLITDAGQVIPGFTKEEDGVEFFVHSPFAKRMNEAEIEDRNQDSLVVQATFLVGKQETKAIFAADTTHEMWGDIVDITKSQKRPERLEWDIMKLAHHCSYLSIGPEKGKDKTEPIKQVKWLYEEQGQQGAIIVSTSEPIPEKGSKADKQDDPPHRQAANYYREVLDANHLD